MERAELTELLRTWKPPAGLNRAWPREVQLKGTGIFLMVMAFLLVTGGLVLGVWLQSVARRDAERLRLLTHDGAGAQATITRLWQTRDDNDSVHWVAFEFPVSGGIQTRRTKVKNSVWKSLTEGGTAPVRYLPSDPSISYLSGSEPKPMPVWAIWLIGASLAFPGGLLLPLAVRRERKLLSEGRAAPGVVTRLSPTFALGLVRHPEAVCFQ